MKRILLSLLCVLAIAFILKAQPLNSSTFGLNDYYDISNWLQFPNSGSINTSGAPNSLVFDSGDSGFRDTTYITIVAPKTIIVKINWTYETFDEYDGYWDYPVYIINGVMHTFSSYDRNGADIQSGIESFAVYEGQTFGFGAYTVDGILGECTINSISFEFKIVPIGISAVLAAFGLIGISFFTRKRLKKARKIE